jgi:helicase MOV-10
MVEAVYQLARRKNKPKILVVAPSNDASDLLVEKLSAYFPPTEMRRLLAFTRSVDQLDSKIKSYAQEKLSAEEVAHEVMSAQIIVCTVNFAARLATYGVPRGHFEVLCVDEAGHATEPEVVSVASTLMDFQRKDDRIGQLVLAGDPKQLGPVVTAPLCRKFGMEISYMERMTSCPVYGKGSEESLPAPLIAKLLHNYRSHPSILKLPNDMFYDGELIAAGNVLKTHDMTRWEYLPNMKFPLIFHAMCGENLREGNSPSWFNPQEAQEVVNYADTLANQSRPSVAQSDIGIITPYARQAQKIRLALASRNLNDIKVGSVEAFQGQERRCIIVSTVRTETELIATDLKYNLGFVANAKRFNVAVTRASSLLVVIGDPHVLAADKKNWLPFLRYCKENQAWAGEEWEDTGDTVFDAEDFVDAKEEMEVGPSAKAAQEGIGFINREE